MKALLNDIDHVLLTKEQIHDKIVELGKQIDDYYKTRDTRVLFLGILKGSVVFMGDLMKSVTIPVEIDFMKVSSYGSGTTHGSINILLDLHRNDLEHTDIIIVEDIIDSGRTLSYLVDYLLLKGAKSVKTITLLDKPERREVEFTPDWTGFIIPNEFVVGYGLDFDEKYRALPFIGVLRPEIYS